MPTFQIYFLFGPNLVSVKKNARFGCAGKISAISDTVLVGKYVFMSYYGPKKSLFI